MYDCHVPLTNQDRLDRPPTRGQELVDSAPKCQSMADEYINSNGSVDLSDEEPTKDHKTIPLVDVHLASDEWFLPLNIRCAND